MKIKYPVKAVNGSNGRTWFVTEPDGCGLVETVFGLRSKDAEFVAKRIATALNAMEAKKPAGLRVGAKLGRKASTVT